MARKQAARGHDQPGREEDDEDRLLGELAAAAKAEFVASGEAAIPWDEVVRHSRIEPAASAQGAATPLAAPVVGAHTRADDEAAAETPESARGARQRDP